MFRKKILVILVIGIIFTSNASANTKGLFGSVEFKAKSLAALPKWQKVLKKIENEKVDFEVCNNNMNDCKTTAMVSWRAFVHSQEGLPYEEIIRETNLFFNQWPYVEDIKNWGVSDYWASPLEFLPKSGDCEDYAIIKFVTLARLGVPLENMRIVVVQDTIRNVAHAVLSVHKEGKRPLILDSLFDAVLPDTKVMQYFPYYSVNKTTRWAHIMPTNNKLGTD